MPNDLMRASTSTSDFGQTILFVFRKMPPLLMGD